MFVNLNKLISIFLCLTLILCLSSCKNHDIVDNDIVDNDIVDNTQSTEEISFYEVNEIRNDDNSFYGYEYIIYSLKGKILAQDTIIIHQPSITKISGSVLEVFIRDGTEYECFYVDIKKEIVSDVYSIPTTHDSICTNDDTQSTLLAYGDYNNRDYNSVYVRVIDVFEAKSIFEKEVFTDFFYGLKDLKFIDNKKLSITYMSNNVNKKITEQIELEP